MDYKDVMKLAEGIDLKGINGKKEFAKRLMANGFNRWSHIYSSAFELGINGLGYYASEITIAMRLVDEENELMSNFGEVGAEYIKAFDKCLDLNLDHHYFDKHNRFGAEMHMVGFPILYSISTFSDSYYCSLQFENNHYNEKFVRSNELDNVDAYRIITHLLNEKINEELAYREKAKWHGEMNLETIVAELKEIFPKYDIIVNVGKRGCDGDVEPYKAIVVYDGKCQLGSLTLEIGSRGVAVLCSRVPMCGEHSYDVTNDDVIECISEEIRFMAN